MILRMITVMKKYFGKIISFVLLVSIALTMISSCDSRDTANQLQEKTYYVSNMGKDSNPGTQQKPWATLQKAVDTAEPGSTIIVKPGNYAGCRITKSGLPDKPITLMGEPGSEKPVIDRAGPQNMYAGNIEIESTDGYVAFWIIDGLKIINALRRGIDARFASNITIQNCEVSHSGTSSDALVARRATGIFTDHCPNILIQNNETSYNVEHGIYISNSEDNPIIRNNRSHDNGICGIQFNGDVTFGPGDGIISGGIIEGNTIYNNGINGGAAINLDGADNTIIKNNLIYNNYKTGIALYAEDGAHGSSNNRIYNNTIVQSENSSGFCISIAASIPGTPDPVNNEIKNNILYSPGGMGIQVYSTEESVLISDYNLAVEGFSAGNKTLTWHQRNSYGYDIHSVKIPTDKSVLDELFTDPSNSNYKLKIRSLAIDMGTELTDEVKYDMELSLRPSGEAYEAGCYEYYTDEPPKAVWVKPASTAPLTAMHPVPSDPQLVSSASFKDSIKPLDIQKSKQVKEIEFDFIPLNTSQEMIVGFADASAGKTFSSYAQCPFYLCVSPSTGLFYANGITVAGTGTLLGEGSLKHVEKLLCEAGKTYKVRFTFDYSSNLYDPAQIFASSPRYDATESFYSSAIYDAPTVYSVFVAPNGDRTYKIASSFIPGKKHKGKISNVSQIFAISPPENGGFVINSIVIKY